MTPGRISRVWFVELVLLNVESYFFFFFVFLRRPDLKYKTMLVAKDICPAVVLVVSFLCEALWLLVARLFFVLFVALLLLSLMDPA